MNAILRFVMLILTAPLLWLWKASGWRVQGELPDVDKLIVIASPHTTNWDYLHVMMGARHFRRKPYTTFKNDWTNRPIIGRILLFLGAIPIDRSKSTNVVQQIVDRIIASDRMLVVFTPEGTRSYREYWKTGFYYAALGAKVPIVLGCPDYPEKIVMLGPVLEPTGDLEADFAIIQEFYGTHGVGKYPEKTNDVRLPDGKVPADEATAEDEVEREAVAE